MPKAIKCEFHLPEPIVQHIQSFLTAKEAAQTTILSKSWREAWLTRPNLAFDTDDDMDDEISIWKLAKETFQRYEESNLKIQSLTLRINNASLDSDKFLLCYNLIAQSLNLGVTHLNLSLRYNFILSDCVVFGSKNLVGLSMERCRIETGSSGQNVIRCSGLESLCLSYMSISLDALSNIISSCPSIRNLSLSGITCLNEDEAGLVVINLHSLTSLHLSYVNFDTLFLSDMSSRFPSLKDLTLHMNSTSSRAEEIRVSCRSLERLNFAQEKERRAKRAMVKFDVPSIRRFTYQGRDIPLLSFESTNSNRIWESRVFIESKKNLDRFWFRRLNEFLTKLGKRSKIHLSLKVRCAESFDYEAGEINQRELARVEDLTVDVKALPYLSCHALFDGLFRICRPNFITQQHVHHRGQSSRVQGKAKSEYFLCKAFLAREGGTSESHFLYYGLRDLEEVNVEVFDEVAAVWRHVPLESLSDPGDDSIRWATEEQKIRFQLKWKRN